MIAILRFHPLACRAQCAWMPAMGRSALVTAGARGLGGAISRHLAERGWSVIIHHHQSSEPAEALASAIGAAGGRTRLIAADLAGREGREALIGALAGE